MQTFQLAAPLRTFLRDKRSEGKSIAFVPTMGALHEGHLSLFRHAKSECDLVVVSIFVNPTQFGPTEDYSAYPRDLPRDLGFASDEEVDAVFHPGKEEIYPQGFETVVDVPLLAAHLEGAHREGHFRGVATVVTKLLNIVNPDRAYFGQKDFQQLRIIERLVQDLNIPTEIVRVPTARASDGLALSSRNAYLSDAERTSATILYRALQHAQHYVAAGGTDADALGVELMALVSSESAASVDYIALVDPESLNPVSTLECRATLLALAVRIGKTRLIDNAILAPPGVSSVQTAGPHAGRF